MGGIFEFRDDVVHACNILTFLALTRFSHSIWMPKFLDCVPFVALSIFLFALFFSRNSMIAIEMKCLATIFNKISIDRNNMQTHSNDHIKERKMCTAFQHLNFLFDLVRFYFFFCIHTKGKHSSFKMRIWYFLISLLTFKCAHTLSTLLILPKFYVFFIHNKIKHDFYLNIDKSLLNLNKYVHYKITASSQTLGWTRRTSEKKRFFWKI